MIHWNKALRIMTKDIRNVFGVDSLLHHEGQWLPVKAILDWQWIQMGTYDGQEVSSYRPVITLRVGDCPQPSKNDIVKIDNDYYEIETIQYDTSGMYTCICRRQ